MIIIKIMYVDFFLKMLKKKKKNNNPNPQFNLRIRIRIRIVFFVQKWGRIRISDSDCHP